MRETIMGIGFDNVTMAQAIKQAQVLMQQPEAAYVVTPNAEIVYEAMHNRELRDLINHADLVLPDGAGVVLASKILKTPLQEKVAGVDFADNLLQVLAETGGSAYLLGSKPGVAELAAEKMLQKHPGLTIAGTADGYFKDEDAVIAKINQAKPDFLFVCLGAPKQEKFMAAHRHELQVKLMALAAASTASPVRSSVHPDG